MKSKIKSTWEKFISYIQGDKRPFAKGLCREKLFLVFVIGCVIGAYYEEILTMSKVLFQTGSLIWEPRRGVLYGPISPIYGAGAVLLTWLLTRNKRPWWLTILYGGLIGGSFEYIVSFLQQTFVGTISWDYAGHFLNINGRTTIPFMLFWGIASFLFTDIVYPKLSQFIESIPYRLGKWITSFLVVFLALDVMISWTALFRQTLRRNHIEPFSVIGELYDRIYPDEVLAKHFPNMQVKESK